MADAVEVVQGATIRVFKEKDLVKIYDPACKYHLNFTKDQARALADRLLVYLYDEAH